MYMIVHVSHSLQAFVYCLYGSNSIYYSTLSMSFCGLLVSALLAYFRSRVSRVKVTFPAYVIIVAVVLVAVLVGEMPEYAYHLLAAVLGVAVVVFHSQIHGMIITQFEPILDVVLPFFMQC